MCIWLHEACAITMDGFPSNTRARGWISISLKAAWLSCRAIMSLIIGNLSDNKKRWKAYMSRIFEFIDPEGSSEPQNHNEVQASYLTLCQYSSKCLLLTSIHMHVLNCCLQAAEALGWKEQTFKSLWHVSHYHWDTATDVGGADSVPAIEDGSGTYQVWYVSACIVVRIHPKWSRNM